MRVRLTSTAREDLVQALTRYRDLAAGLDRRWIPGPLGGRTATVLYASAS